MEVAQKKVARMHEEFYSCYDYGSCCVQHLENSYNIPCVQLQASLSVYVIYGILHLVKCNTSVPMCSAFNFIGSRMWLHFNFIC